MTLQATNVSISINSGREKVYQFVSNPENFPQWLGFVKSVSKKSGNNWTADTDLGHIEMAMPPANEFGVIDHVVTLPDGTKVNNHLRVINNQQGSEVIFTLFKMPGKTEKEFEEDANLVRADLVTLKKLLED